MIINTVIKIEIMKYYFIQEFKKGLFEDEAKLVSEKEVFGIIENLVSEGKKFTIYKAQCVLDLT